MKQNLKRNCLVTSKGTSENWHFLTWTLENLKLCTLMGCFWPKCIILELKHYRGVMFDGFEYWCKICKKTYLCFQKWHEQFRKFSPGQARNSKNWDFMSLELTGELCVMTMKKDTKFKEEFTCQFKIDMKNLTNFDLNTL